MIRSSSHSLKFTNKVKQEVLLDFISRYKEMVGKYINIIWNKDHEKIKSLLDNKICQSIKTRVESDSRIRQCAAKQACSMIKAVKDKQNKRFAGTDIDI